MSDDPTIWQAPPVKQPRKLEDMTSSELGDELRDRGCAFNAASNALMRLVEAHRQLTDSDAYANIETYGRDYQDALIVYHTKREALQGINREYAKRNLQ